MYYQDVFEKSYAKIVEQTIEGVNSDSDYDKRSSSEFCKKPIETAKQKQTPAKGHEKSNDIPMSYEEKKQLRLQIKKLGGIEY